MTAAAAEPRTLHVALVGNPNCGKTALFNALTGARQKVANYAGVTVERKEGRVTSPAGNALLVLDLPGTYSLRARSPDEAVTRDAVLGRLENEAAPDVLVCVADATSLRLVLRLVLELKAVGRPIVIALNMFDIAERQGVRIDIPGLSSALGVPIVTTVATRKRGLQDLLSQVDGLIISGKLGAQSAAAVWREPASADVRRAHRQAEQMLKAYVKPPLRPETLTGRLDCVLLHPVLGSAVLMLILFLMFQAVFTWARPLMELITAGFNHLNVLIRSAMPDSPVRGLLTDGVISGVGSVIVFLPQIMILFLFIILLEDFGYMARAAFLMDRLMGGAGLHGRAFIPLLSSFACAIPGIMATRVIDNRRDRLTTILVAPLTTCSARIPVYTLIIAAFIPARTVWGVVNLQGLVMFGLYAAGMSSALLVAFVVRKIFWRGASEPFLMQLPDYKLPEPAHVLQSVWTRAAIFLKRAGTTILAMMVLIWVLSSLPLAPHGATGPAINYSFAGIIGHALQPLLAPIGFNWQIAVALIPGMAAREVAVGALGAVYAISGESSALGGVLARQWPLATALSLLAWYVFAPQCMSTLAVIRRETNSWRWPVITFVYMLTLAYLAAFIVYQTAHALGG